MMVEQWLMHELFQLADDRLAISLVLTIYRRAEKTQRGLRVTFFDNAV